MHLSNEEVIKVTAAGGFEIGGDRTGTITVNGITDDQSFWLFPTVTFLAAADGGQVVFDGGSSTFGAMAAQADNGVLVKANQSTTFASMYLDGDFEDDAAGDSTNGILLEDRLTVTCRTMLTLEATTGGIVPQGSLSIRTGAGVVLLNDVTSDPTGGAPLVIRSDYDSEGDGTVTVAAGSSLDSNGNELLLTIWDLDLQGYVNSHGADTTIHPVVVDQSFGIGKTPRNTHLSDAELGRVCTTSQLIVGSSSSGTITVNGITQASSPSS